ncbi:MAG: hypothetical protein VB101_05345, partial [Rhodospirillaceae bacterium]|nr:hypothetical protein [Rhodospirillaceae bacterium]
MEDASVVAAERSDTRFGIGRRPLDIQGPAFPFLAERLFSLLQGRNGLCNSGLSLSHCGEDGNERPGSIHHHIGGY